VVVLDGGCVRQHEDLLLMRLSLDGTSEDEHMSSGGATPIRFEAAVPQFTVPSLVGTAEYYRDVPLGLKPWRRSCACEVPISSRAPWSEATSSASS
jgi:hypothetical protein